MATFLFSSRAKKGFFILFLSLIASSLFAIVLPNTYFTETEPEKIESITLLPPAHPLTGSSDAVVICPNDNTTELHEIYLCGASAERLLTTNIPNLQSITWSRLSDTQTNCSATTNCPSNSPGCNWDNQSTDTQYNVTLGGEYRMLVQYNDGSGSDRFYFNVYTNGLNPSPVVTNIDCGTPGSITVNNVPSTYEYSINNGATWQTSNVFSITSVSTYDILIRRLNDTDGCLFTLDDIAVDNNAINATATLLPITCNSAFGSIQIDIADASSSYIYEISQGGSPISSGPTSNSSYTFTDLGPGNYNINVRLASVSACSWDGTLTVLPFVNVTPDAVVTKAIDCTDGVITVTKTGGVAPFEYSLTGSAPFTPFTAGNQTTIPIATDGTYTITLRDASGCEIDALPIDIATQPEITYDPIVPQNITCNGSDDGSITINVTDTQGYSISYSNDGGATFQTSNVFSNLAIGDYDIVIRKQKAGGICDLPPSTQTIAQSPAFVATASVPQQIDCVNGQAHIEATVTAGGTAPFEYSLDGVIFQPTVLFTGLGPGDYTITVKDVNGCLTTVDQTVNAGSNPTDLTFLTSNVDCSTGETDVQVSVQNGSGTITYEIIAPTPITTPNDTFTALSPNTYTFEIVANGCTIVRNFVVQDPIQFTSNALVKTNVSCATGTADGSIEVSVENFNTSFTVVVEDSSGIPLGLGLSNQTTSPLLIPGLADDNYTLKISDESGPCQKEEILTILAPGTALAFATTNPIVVANINCGAPGSVTVEVAGGWGNYRYSVEQPDGTVTPLQSNKTISGLLQEGTHTLTVIDANGCPITDNFNLIDQGGPEAIVDQAASAYCYSVSTPGELKIDVTDNGTAPYFYTVNDGTPLPVIGGTFTLSNLTPATYVVKVIANNGCETVVVDTNISGQLFAFANITKPLGCGSPIDAIIEVTPENGYPPYTYEVDNGTGYIAATMPFSTNTVGSYNFKITDDKGCEFYIGDPNVALGTVNGTQQPVIVTLAPVLVPIATDSPTACGKDGTGSIQLSASGGTPPFLFALSENPFAAGTNDPVYSTQSLYSGLDATTYYYSIIDDLGCTSGDLTKIVGAEAAIDAQVDPTNITCEPFPGSGNVWGNAKVSNITNTTGLLNIRLLRVRNKTNYENGTDDRTWTYRNYENVDMSLPQHLDGFDIRMYWAADFVVIVEDEKGCFYESDVFTITAPTFPNGSASQPDPTPTCPEGANFLFTINPDPTLVGPFEARLWPYDVVDSNGDGIEDDITNDWRPFDDFENPEYNGTPNEHKYLFQDSALYGKLLFGVNYAVIVRDLGTGCIRWRNLGIVDPPTDALTIDVLPQSETCLNARDGQAEITITGAAAGPISYRIYNASNPLNTGFHYGNYYGNGHVVNSDGVNPITFLVPEDLRVAWYVLEVEDTSGCTIGERFLIYRPKSKLTIKTEQVAAANCFVGAQISVSAVGGWDNQAYFNVRNKLDQAKWHPYEYAFVLSGDTPGPADWGPDTYKEVPFVATNQSYDVYVRDGSGCDTQFVTVPVTLDASPEIDVINVTNRCTSTNEIYNVEATLLNTGTNPIDGAPKYIWDGQVTTNNTAQLGPGNHTLEVRDENGCSVSQNIFIYPQLATPSARITRTEQCSPTNNTGEVEIDVYGGSLDYTYEKIVGGTVVETHVSADPDAELFTGLTHSVAYTFRITDNLSGCAFKETTITLDVPVLPEFEAEPVQHISCNGANDGILRIIQQTGATNLDIPYEYSIDNGATYQTSNVFSGLAPGVYTDINVRSSKSCIQSLNDVEILSNPLLVINSTSVSPFACTTDNNLGMATVTVNVTGGTGSGTYKYSFDSGSFTSSNTYDLPYLSTARTISVDVIDDNNCPATVDVDIPAASKISATISTTIPMTCTDDGEYLIEVDPSFTNITIEELPGTSGLATFSGDRNRVVTIQAGNPNTYSFLITDTATSCTDLVTIDVLPFDSIGVSAVHGSDITCYTSADGTFDFTATGFGTSGFNYEVFQASGGSQQASVGPVTTATALSISSLPAGTFYVRITDADTGCTADSEVISIQSPVDPLDFTIATTQVLTCIGGDAQITLTPFGGWGDYEFEVVETLSGNVIQAYNSNNVIDNLIGISYDVNVRDSEGCSLPMAKSVSITPIDPINIDETAHVTIQDPTCPGDDDGRITMTYTRTNGPTNYEYILTNLATGVSLLPQSNPIFDNLNAGSYTVRVQDQLNCFDTTETLVITDPYTILINGDITMQPTCAPNSGQITVNATSGNSVDSFTYEMIRPATHPLAGIPQATGIYSNLGPEVYEFIAHNNSGCTTPISVIRTINVVEPYVLAPIDMSNAIINCNGEMDAVLVATASGGLGDYQYEITKPDTTTETNVTGIFTGLGAGSYTIRSYSLNATDCNASETVVIDAPRALLVPNPIMATPVACHGDKTGSVDVSPTDGEAPYSFYISSEPQKAYSTGIFENLEVGSYTVIVQDKNGCEVARAFDVTGPSELETQQVRIVDEVCSSDDNGLIEYTITGGTPPYSYALGDDPTNFITLSGGTLLLDNLDGGFYEIIVQDANDCEPISEEIYVEVKVGSDLTSTVQTLSECQDGLPFYTASVVFEDEDLDTSEIVYVLDDATPDNPDVSNSSSIGVFENISAGSHTISIAHLVTGCVEVKTFNIEAQEVLTLTALDGEINQILVEAQGGDGLYTYYFDDTPSSENFYYINTTGNYTVRVVDGKGCETTIEVPLEYIDIEIPNFFTPDGDGYKDTWVIKNSEGFPDMYVRIYDRYGRTIKEFIGQGEWDGSYENADMPTGDYWYVLKLNGPRDDREFVGHFTVYR